MKNAIKVGVIVLVSGVLLAGCASNNIIIDQKGVDLTQYKEDLVECRAYAEQVEKGKEVAKGAARGAVVGGVIGAAIGNRGTAGRVAGAGAASGASRGMSKAEWEEHKVVRNCLRGRGYKVLN